MTEHKTERIDIRTNPSAKAVLQQAAIYSNKTVSEFLLETGLQAAQDALTNRKVFSLSDEQWNAFQQALDAPPTDKPALKELLTTPSVFN